MAVLLTTSEGEEILLGKIRVENGSVAEDEHFKILNLLMEKGIDLNKIIACVCGTTAVNTDEKNGIIKRLKTFLSHAPLEFAYRHNVYELIRGAVSEFVRRKSPRTKDKTTASYKPLFKKLCSAWNDINTDSENVRVFNTKNLFRTLLPYRRN